MTDDELTPYREVLGRLTLTTAKDPFEIVWAEEPLMMEVRIRFAIAQIKDREGHLFVNFPIVFDPLTMTPEQMLALIGRYWLEGHIHEACEQFLVDGEPWMSPHSEGGFMNYLRAETARCGMDRRQRGGKLGRMIINANREQRFGRLFHSRGVW